MKLSNDYYVRKAHLKNDREEILNLWTRNDLNGPDPSKHLIWAYENNPAGLGLLWLLVHMSSQKIIGSAGLIPRRMKVNDSVVLVGRAGGFAVDKGYRSIGPALLLQRTVAKEAANYGISLIYSSVPLKAAIIVKRCGYKNIGAFECRRRLISTSAAIKNRLPLFPRIARRLLSCAIDLCFNFIAKKNWNWWRNKKFKLIRNLEFDNRFDALWDRSSHQYSLTTERTAVFLNWRFSNNPKARGFVCDALISHDTIHGYVIYRIVGQVAYIIDLFVEDQDDLINILISALAKALRSEGVSSIIIGSFNCERFFNYFRKVGFWLKNPTPASYGLFVRPVGELVSLKIPMQLDWGFQMVDDFNDNLGLWG